MLRSLPKLSLLFSSARNPRYLKTAQRFTSQGRRPTSRVKIGAATTLSILSKSTSTISSAIASESAAEDQVQQIKLLTSTDDNYGGVTVELDHPMDSSEFIQVLRASVSHWRQLGKKGIWIKLPIHLAGLVEALVKEGFWYHHAEPNYLMLVYWIPDSPSTIPANATHRVGIGSFVMNEKQEVLVVQENSGLFKGTGIWKFPTGVVDQGEDICVAAVREVKEETGVDSEFVEVLAFRQSHNSFFEKSDLFFVCMLRPLSFNIQTQRFEILDAQWMPFEEYAAQPFVQKSELLKYINDTCLAKMGGQYSGFCPVSTSSNFSDQKNYLYLNAGTLKSSYSS
ncbi:nudix hydrolase 2 isoform X1 [Vigna radiata var. radiata]|uniref:Nudix hydrolase 2 isoform X1 n=1 Tax=Vigna radiata var. radiata TaxID=3916 RepID=A0A3Q0FFL5_VIGRR|nr:nudix hydrolase 2 isoform X1 [Vigna radiata var. radiata]XP_022642452.1 nudix hydrolase 2 isoform X1 [Vigna radiata var. radiata]